MDRNQKKKSVAVIFDESHFPKNNIWKKQFDVVIAPRQFKAAMQGCEITFYDIDELIEPGSIYEASALAEELSLLKFSDGSRISKSYKYKGYELWWMNYNSIFLYYCLPYTQYKKLLEYLLNFQKILLFNPPYKGLFSCYLRAHEREFKFFLTNGSKILSFLPFGVFLQIIITILSLLTFLIKRGSVMVFTGDKFEKTHDYDFRMKFIYEGLRAEKIDFVEFIRSLESWKTVIKHAFTRKRPVIYSEAIVFVGRFLSVITGGRIRLQKKLKFDLLIFPSDSMRRFKFLVATQHLFSVSDDIWAIRISKCILRIIAVKVALIPAAMERNFHAVIGCKLNAIPTIGILHGVASRFYNVYDFLPEFDGEKSLSVDKYGLWSQWWKEYYQKFSKAYQPEQLCVSGPMRPLENTVIASSQSQPRREKQIIKVLFVPGELSNPEEIIPYLEKLMISEDVSVYLTFRPYRDRFENWLNKNNPQLIEKLGKDKILLGNIHDAITKCDVVVGSYSTGSLEALLQLRPVIFFHTVKWGDYFEMKDYDSKYKFFAENPEELINLVIKENEIPIAVLENLRERFFGDPYKNGSKWMIEEAKSVLGKKS